MEERREEQFEAIYFVGIGGIGMSALARYFRAAGKAVAGYDRTPSALTRELEAAGIDIHYTDDVEAIPSLFRDKERCAVIWTPAVPDSHAELTFFRKNGFSLHKRSQALGLISAGKYVMAVSGTHGKTSTTTMLALFNAMASDDGTTGSAFLGGISKNFGSNLVMGTGKRMAVEADEFDRSFLQLRPDVALVTSTDADHLDIYKDLRHLRESFSQFVGQVKKGGAVICRYGIGLKINNPGIAVYTYSGGMEGDFHPVNIRRCDDGTYRFDIVCPDRTVKDCHLSVPGLINVENCVGAVAMMWWAGFDEAKLKTAIDAFRGVKRRFDFHINTPSLSYMDDYAHHPAELQAAIMSVRRMFPGRKITAVFQPHLYTRTRDFAEEFARALSLADRVVLLPIYPAREEPIAGVTSEIIFDRLTVGERYLIGKEKVLEFIAARRPEIDVLITFGAGDIDRLVQPLNELLSKTGE